MARKPLKLDFQINIMNKKSPILHGDGGIYNLSRDEIEFALNARRLFDFGYGIRFDEYIVNKLKLKVGLLVHNLQVSLFDDSVTEAFFKVINSRGIEFLYAIPTGYIHDKDNERSMEVFSFFPPLVGKIQAVFSGFSEIRNGQIGLYSGSHYLFSSCLKYGFLDVNGEYSLILGDDNFVKDVVGEDSWNTDRLRQDVSACVFERIMMSKIAYGYF